MSLAEIPRKTRRGRARFDVQFTTSGYPNLRSTSRRASYLRRGVASAELSIGEAWAARSQSSASGHPQHRPQKQRRKQRRLTSLAHSCTATAGAKRRDHVGDIVAEHGVHHRRCDIHHQLHRIVGLIGRRNGIGDGEGLVGTRRDLSQRARKAGGAISLGRFEIQPGRSGVEDFNVRARWPGRCW